nr:immunoglobulin light chain junction region [Macaca mulatta]MOX84530.1 immunoglobulin light chain junction region [Macaca mulatta]MOX84562.1 immunoglobulin light chain junction region [Macaca mulatta]MOX84785.1 immunoglobulin light chain junction region [Macaca mulatta]MOX84926.1 immunoglobulin light chain junction region [Macaca mulatta]
CMQARDFPWTF